MNEIVGLREFWIQEAIIQQSQFDAVRIPSGQDIF